ncbi:hypothetical protein LTR95_003779 [Oleoguttula sp. CCFEE 5521]
MTTLNSETQTDTVATSGVPPPYPNVVIYTSELIGSGVESVDHTVANDSAFRYGEIKLAQNTALQHVVKKAGGVQIPLAGHGIAEAGDSGQVQTPRLAVQLSQPPEATPSDATFMFAVVTWKGNGLPPAKLSDLIRSELQAKPLNRTPIEKRMWLKKDPVTNGCRWRWASVYMFTASDSPSVDLESWNARVQYRMKQVDAANALSASINLSRLRVKVTAATLDTQTASTANLTSTVVSPLNDKDHKSLSQALLIAEVAQRRSAALVGNTVFDADARGTATVKGLTLCFGTRQHAEIHEGLAHKPSPAIVPKLFFASGSVADFLLSRVPESQQTKINDGSNASEDNNVLPRRYLRGVRVAYVDDNGEDASRVILDVDASPVIIFGKGSDDSHLVHPNLPRLNVGSKRRPQ